MCFAYDGKASIDLPRMMIAAPKSGSGKTMLSCVLLELLKSENKNIFSVKAGPDYIDPLFHETVQDVRCFNLDTFFTDRQATRKLLYEDMINAKERSRKDNAVIRKKQECGKSMDEDAPKENESPFCLMEGVMGLYDGIGGVELHGSSYELAQWTRTPVILVVDAKGAGRSLLATIAGMQKMDTDHLISGVVLNRISEGFYPRIKELIESELDICVFGFLPEREELAIESRYLGLVLPDEIANISKRIKAAADIARNSINIEEICRVMESAEEIFSDQDDNGITKKGISAGCDLPRDFFTSGDAHPTLNLAIAKDEAFCFYYRENLRMFEQAGFRLVPFSPIRDTALPQGAHALLLGGGYPELHAKALSENHRMRESIRKAIRAGMPTIAECGGFLYLHEWLRDKEGVKYPMCGVVRAGAFYGRRSIRFGYIIIEETRSDRTEGDAKNPASEAGRLLFKSQSVRGHEFHHYESEDCGGDLTAKKPYDGRTYRTGHLFKGQYFGFPHLYLPSAPAFVQSFVKEAESYAH